MAKNSSSFSSAPREALGRSEAFLAFQEKLSRAARVDRPVLIVGERGTGKELAAARLHYLSPRGLHTLVALNCAALAPTLMESELFGFEAGSFTGAVRGRAGRFETADGGTLFLDEIALIPLEVQSKILRVVEYQTFERVGSSIPIQVDVRIIGAANVDLPLLASRGGFKRDLLDRLSFEVLVMPPLRDRAGDIALLAHHFAARMSQELGWDDVPVLEESALRELENHPWPGNVRELKNVVERAVYRSDSAVISQIEFNPFPAALAPPGRDALPVAGRAPATARPSDRDDPLAVPLLEQTAALEKELLATALERSRRNQMEAALLLGLTYHQFRGLFRKYGFSRQG
ncbi:MAG: sigma 54-interacting transcriptional regulator [Pseudomonadota bacterium]